MEFQKRPDRVRAIQYLPDATKGFDNDAALAVGSFIASRGSPNRAVSVEKAAAEIRCSGWPNKNQIEIIEGNDNLGYRAYSQDWVVLSCFDPIKWEILSPEEFAERYEAVPDAIGD